MEALDKESLGLKPQTLRIPTSGFMACANKPPFDFLSHSKSPKQKT